MPRKEYKQRALKCECGSCTTCGVRERMRRSRANRPDSASKGRDRARAHYDSLTVEERKARCAGRVEYQRDYKAANRDRIKAVAAERRASRRAEFSKRDKEYYQKNADEIKARVRAYREANPQASAERVAKWVKDHPEKRRIISKVASHKRRALIEECGGGTVTKEQLAELFKRQGGKCAGCKKRLGKFEDGKWEHDHVMPINLKGTNTIENAQILCPTCNRKKHKKHPDRWAAELGRLFA